MTLPAAPHFDPDRNRNQHFVPRFWQRRFAAANGSVFARYRPTADPIRDKKPRSAGKARQASVDDTMAQDWTYTLFDGRWRPSNALEHAIAKDEGAISRVVDAVCDPKVPVTAELREDLCIAIGFAACRTPGVMARGHRLGKEYAAFLASIHRFQSMAAFNRDMVSKFGVALSREDYDSIKCVGEEHLLEEYETIKAMSPQDPRLPQQYTLLASRNIAASIAGLDLALLETVSSAPFVLGDTPLPDRDLARGFVVPLSATLALRGSPATATPRGLPRTAATPAEVTAVNKEQFDMSAEVVIGPDPALLDAL